MFAISIQQNQYRTYTLSDQAAQSRLEVVPERGGLITRWQLQGQDILYLDAERFADPTRSVRGGIPILFPICGNLPDDQYTEAGQTYTLKQHGFARDLPWQVIDRQTQSGVQLTLQLDSNEQTRAVYPFEFRLIFTYRLQGNSLEIRQQVLNQSDRPMPFSMGLHPYFAVADKTQLEFEIPATQFQDQITKEMHTFSGEFDWNRDEIDIAFRPISQHRAQARDRHRQLQLNLEFDETYSTLVFWTVRGKDYYCLEPWTAPRNALNSGEDLILLEPGAEHDSWVRLSAMLE